MKVLHQFSLIMTVLLVLVSCNNDDDNVGCDLPPLYPINSLENLYNCENTENDMEIDLNDAYVLIRTQAEFDALVSGTCTPQIDFDTYDLLIGKQALTNGLNQIAYSASICGNTIHLFIQFDLNATDIAPNVTYHVLLDKVASDRTLDVILNIQ